jgi:hypothetical protein
MPVPSRLTAIPDRIRCDTFAAATGPKPGVFARNPEPRWAWASKHGADIAGSAPVARYPSPRPEVHGRQDWPALLVSGGRGLAPVEGSCD